MDKGSGRLLLFNIRGQRYALELLNVAEVLSPPVTFPVPWVPPYFKGAMNFHGSLVAIIDLAQVMGIGTMAADGNIVVLHKEVANLGLGIDSVEGTIPADDILEEEESSNPLVEKVLFLADGEVSKLALDLLLERISEALQR